MGQLEDNLAKEADKKGLTGDAKKRYIGGAIHNIKKHVSPKKKKHSERIEASKEKAKQEDEKQKNREAYNAKKREERKEQDKKDYERITRERTPHWSLSGHDKAVLKREGNRREAEYKQKQEALEKQRKEQKRNEQEAKHETLYNAGRKPVYVVYAAKNAGDTPKEIEAFKTAASADRKAYNLRNQGYHHATYKMEYES